MAPLKIAKPRIILFLISYIAGIICFHQLDQIVALGKSLLHINSAAFRVTFSFVIIYVWLLIWTRAGALLGMVMFSLNCGAISCALAALQYTVHKLTQLGAPRSAGVTAKIIDIDDWASGQSHLSL